MNGISIRIYYGSSIAFAIRSFDPSLFSQLIVRLISFDRSLSIRLISHYSCPLITTTNLKAVVMASNEHSQGVILKNMAKIRLYS